MTVACLCHPANRMIASVTFSYYATPNRNAPLQPEEMRCLNVI